MITLENFKNKIASGEISKGSSLSMRNENAQKKQRSARIPNLKKEVGKTCRLLVPKELAFDFDPTTGSSEEYNAERKFRPMMSATSLALIVKGYANEIPATKEKLMATAGITEWDTTSINELTETDFKVFNCYAYPQIFTVPVFNTTLPGLAQQAWGRSYIIKVERDEAGAIIGDVPLPLMANRFYNSIANEKIEAYEATIKSGANKDDQKTQTDKKTEIRRQCSRVSSDYPQNYIIPLELELTAEGSIAGKCITGVSADSISGLRRITKYSKELHESIEKFRTGKWKIRDIYLDFYEIDMTCPTDVDENDKAQLGLRTRYEKPESECILKGTGAIEDFVNAYREEVDNRGDIEKLVLASTGVTPYTQDVEAKMLEILEDNIDLKSEDITQKVIEHNKDFIQLVFGSDGEEAIMEIEAGVSDRNEGALDFEKAQADGKKYDLDKLLEESDEFDDLAVETIV